MRLDEEFISNGKDYQARGIIARIHAIGYYNDGPLVRRPIHQYLTLDCGKGKPSICVKYVGEAKFVDRDGERFLDMTGMKEGQIVVSPGFVYQKIEFSTRLMAEHLRALKTYRPHDILFTEKDGGPAIDLGDMNKPH